MLPDIMEAQLDAGAAPDAAGEGLAAAATAKSTRSKLKCEDTLLSICRSYGISSKLYRPLCAKDGWEPWRAPPEASNALCVFEAMLEAGVRFPLHELYNKVLTYFNLAPGQLVPRAWRQLAGFVLVCEDVGVTPMAAVFRYYFKLVPAGTSGWYSFRVNCGRLLFDESGGHVNPRWKERWFFLDSIMADDHPWRCPREWGTPSGEKEETPPQVTRTAWDAIYKLNAAVKGDKGLSLTKLIIDKSQYNHNFPVLPPLQEQVKSEAETETGGSHEDPSTHPPAKRLCLPATAVAKIKIITTPPRQLDIGATSSSAPPGPSTGGAGDDDELSRTQMACQMIQETVMELGEKLKSEQAARAEALGVLKAELTGQLQAVQAERDSALTQLKEATAKLTVCYAAQAEHTSRVRHHQAAKAELRTKVHHLEELLLTAEATHIAHVQRLEDERREAEAKLQQLAEELQAEKGKRAVEVNAVRALCNSQLKAARDMVIKAISEALPVQDHTVPAGAGSPPHHQPPALGSVTDMDVLLEEEEEEEEAYEEAKEKAPQVETE